MGASEAVAGAGWAWLPGGGGQGVCGSLALLALERPQPAGGRVSFFAGRGVLAVWALGRLPLEHEWEGAAGGPEGHEYPGAAPWRMASATPRMPTSA